MKIDKQERLMLIEAAKTFKEADQGFLHQGYASYGPIDNAQIRKWNSLIKKLKAVKTGGKK